MKNILILVIVIAVVGGGFFLFKSFTQKSAAPVVTTKTSTDGATSSSQSNQDSSPLTITYTNSGFSSAGASVKSGGSITWVNKGDKEIQIGANPHPVHSGNREITGGGFVITLQPGQQTTVTVNKVGSFDYHNHLNSSQGGTINVEK